MASIVVTIPDGSPELEELLQMVVEARLTNPGITSEEFVSNLVMGYATNRVINIYKGYVGNLTLAEMVDKLGSLSEVR